MVCVRVLGINPHVACSSMKLPWSCKVDCRVQLKWHELRTSWITQYNQSHQYDVARYSKHWISILIKKRDLSVRLCISPCGDLWRWSDQGHIFRKYRRKNNKKEVLLTGKRQKTAWVTMGICHQLLCIGLRRFYGIGAYVTSVFSYARYICPKKLCMQTARLSPGCLPWMIGLYSMV